MPIAEGENMRNDFKTVTVEVNDNIAILRLDNPPVNQLSTILRNEMAQVFDLAFASSEIKAIVLTGTGKNFMAGGDITEMAAITDKDQLFDMVMEYNKFHNAIEDGPKPVIAAINGPALGGGLELAMACHHRIAGKGVIIGQPEVQLGLIPGAGGTQRLPRLCGLADALTMITTGAPASAEQGMEKGIIDEVVPFEELIQRAVDAAKDFVSGKKDFNQHRTRTLKDKLSTDQEKQGIIEFAKGVALKKAKGLPAPFKAIQAMEQGLSDDFSKDIELEAGLFSECAVSQEAKNLINIFLNSRTTGRLERTKGVEPAKVKTVAILGLGVMGSGIANLLLKSGFKAVLWDINDDATAKGLHFIKKTFSYPIKKGKMTQDDLDSLISDNALCTTDINDINDADLVIEAVVENMDVKKDIWTKADSVCRPDTVFATNTSALSIAELAATLNDPSRMLGLHFFNPAERMQLVEVIAAQNTSDSALATGVAFSRKIKKIPVVVNDGPGFYTSRQINALMGECNFMLEQGIPLFIIDKALYDFGMPMGAFTLHDLTGIDIGLHVADYFEKTFGPRWKVSEIHRKIFETGCYGRKTGSGYYDYTNEKPVPNKIVTDMVGSYLKENNIAPKENASSDELAKIMLARAINEAAYMMEEGICDNRPWDMDLAMVYGCGYPAPRGGIFRDADTWGIKEVYDYIVELEGKFGERFSPSPLLKDMADKEITFYCEW